MPPRTIDNLGSDIYNRYAEDQKTLDNSLVREQRPVYQQALVDVTKASYASQFSLFLGLSLLHPSWATFQAPKGYSEKHKILFTNQILPFIGNQDKKEEQVRRVKERPKQEQEEHQGGFGGSWEDEKEQQEEQQEKEALLSLFTCIDTLDTDIMEVNTRRKQYQKG